MDPTNVENGRGKVPHDPSLPFASTFSGMSHIIFPDFHAVCCGLSALRVCNSAPHTPRPLYPQLTHRQRAEERDVDSDVTWLAGDNTPIAQRLQILILKIHTEGRVSADTYTAIHF